MTSPACVHLVDVGAYVLGALEPAERSTVEQHLPTCPACSAQLSDLAGLPGLLSRLSLAEAEGSAAPAPTRVLDALLARAGRRRRRLRLVGAAAAVIAVIGLGTGIGLATTHDAQHGTVLTANAGSIGAQATLHAVPAGTAIDLQLTGVPAETRCRLVVVATDGTTIDAGTWYAGYTGRAGVRETAALERDEVSALRVETVSGRPLITVPVAGA